MSVKKNMFQQGSILNEVVVGVFRTNGTTLAKWCEQNDISTTQAQNALRGTSSGVKGLELVDRLVEGAGRDIVEAAYRKRVQMHAKAIGEVA